MRSYVSLTYFDIFKFLTNVDMNIDFANFSSSSYHPLKKTERKWQRRTGSRNIAENNERQLTRKIRGSRLSRGKEGEKGINGRGIFKRRRQRRRRRRGRCRIFPLFHSILSVTTVLHRVGIHFNEFAFQRDPTRFPPSLSPPLELYFTSIYIYTRVYICICITSLRNRRFFW